MFAAGTRIREPGSNAFQVARRGMAGRAFNLEIRFAGSAITTKIVGGFMRELSYPPHESCG